MKITATKNPILYLCGRFVSAQQKNGHWGGQRDDFKGLSTISMLVVIAYKLGKVVNVEIIKPTPLLPSQLEEQLFKKKIWRKWL